MEYANSFSHNLKNHESLHRSKSHEQWLYKSSNLNQYNINYNLNDLNDQNIDIPQKPVEIRIRKRPLSKQSESLNLSQQQQIQQSKLENINLQYSEFSNLSKSTSTFQYLSPKQTRPVSTSFLQEVHAVDVEDLNLEPVSNISCNNSNKNVTHNKIPLSRSGSLKISTSIHRTLAACNSYNTPFSAISEEQSHLNSNLETVPITIESTLPVRTTSNISDKYSEVKKIFTDLKIPKFSKNSRLEFKREKLRRTVSEQPNFNFHNQDHKKLAKKISLKNTLSNLNKSSQSSRFNSIDELGKNLGKSCESPISIKASKSNYRAPNHSTDLLEKIFNEVPVKTILQEQQSQQQNFSRINRSISNLDFISNFDSFEPDTTTQASRALHSKKVLLKKEFEKLTACKAQASWKEKLRKTQSIESTGLGYHSSSNFKHNQLLKPESKHLQTSYNSQTLPKKLNWLGRNKNNQAFCHSRCF